jgi:hypothetical protein
LIEKPTHPISVFLLIFLIFIPFIFRGKKRKLRPNDGR